MKFIECFLQVSLNNVELSFQGFAELGWGPTQRHTHVTYTYILCMQTYNRFLVFMVVMFCRVATNTELANIEPLLLGEI